MVVVGFARTDDGHNHRQGATFPGPRETHDYRNYNLYVRGKISISIPQKKEKKRGKKKRDNL